MKHSVILSSFNRPRMVREAIASVLNQTRKNWQLIVTDDASNADTLTAIHESIKFDPRCVVLSKFPEDGPRPNGVRRAVDRINDAIQHVVGDIVHYLPDDDYFALDRFVTFDEVFADESVVVAYGMVEGRTLDGKLAGGIYHPDVGCDAMNRLDHNQVAHRSSVFRTFGSWTYPTRLGYETCMDGEWFMRLATRWRMAGVPRVVAYKRIHEHNLQKTGESTTSVRE